MQNKKGFIFIFLIECRLNPIQCRQIVTPSAKMKVYSFLQYCIFTILHYRIWMSWNGIVVLSPCVTKHLWTCCGFWQIRWLAAASNFPTAIGQLSAISTWTYCSQCKIKLTILPKWIWSPINPLPFNLQIPQSGDVFLFLKRWLQDRTKYVNKSRIYSKINIWSLCGCWHLIKAI